MVNKVKNNISNFGYSGHLSVKLKRGNKELRFRKHNEGLAPLFQLICMTITNNSNASLLLPTTIDICNSTGQISRLSKALSISAGIVMYTDSTHLDAFNNPLYGIRIRTQIQRQNIITVSDITEGDCIFLKSANDSLLARIQLTSDEISTLKSLNDSSNGLSGLIEWDMKFSNNTDTNE